MSKVKPTPITEVDFTTLKPGLYLRSKKSVGLFGTTKVWDLRFTAPADKNYMSVFTLNTISLIFDVKLREYLGNAYIQSFPVVDGTAFGLVTTGISEDKVRHAIVEAIEDVVPIVNRDEIPYLATSPRPTAYSLKPSTDYLWSYRCTLLNTEEEL